MEAKYLVQANAEIFHGCLNSHGWNLKQNALASQKCCREVFIIFSTLPCLLFSAFAPITLFGIGPQTSSVAIWFGQKLKIKVEIGVGLWNQDRVRRPKAGSVNRTSAERLKIKEIGNV